MIKTESRGGRPKKTRASASLSVNLDKNLLAYAAAASAAAVSLLALSQPAEAKILYTKASREIAPRGSLELILNGNIAFGFDNGVSFGTSNRGTFIDNLTIGPSGRNGVLGHASVLRPGVSVGPKGRFRTNGQTMFKFSQYCTPDSNCRTQTKGGWKNITGGYLGLKFFIRGKAHYGWARLNATVTDEGYVYALLTGYAYETIANKAIITGKTKGEESQTRGLGAGSQKSLNELSSAPGTLGRLAQGAAGLATSRK